MNTAKGGCDDRERACVVVDVICRVEPRRVGAQRDSCSKTVVVAMKKSRIKKSRKRAMLRGVDAIVRGAAQSVRQSSAAKGMAGLIKSLRTN